MSRRTRFFVGLAAAVLTYATLAATIGPRHAWYRNGDPYRAYGYGRHAPCDDARRDQLRRPGNTPEAAPSRQPGVTPNP